MNQRVKQLTRGSDANNNHAIDDRGTDRATPAIECGVVPCTRTGYSCAGFTASEAL